MFLTPITESEIISIVTALPPKKSCGHDNISILLIKSVINTIAKLLCAIFNKSFLTGQFPSYLKIARISPIYKSGEKNNMINYRPISVLPSFSKIIEKLVHTCLMSFLNSNNILHFLQHGFCSSHNVATAILDVLNYVVNMKTNHFINLLLFIDISKAFDSLSHIILLQKLKYYGIRGIVHKRFTSHLSNRFHCVQLGTLSLSLAPLTTAVPQGSTLGTILFLQYVNDVFTINRNCKIVLFADNTCISVSANNSNTLFQLCNIIFCDCSEWFSSNMLALNIKKTNFMIIGHIANNQYPTLILIMV